MVVLAFTSAPCVISSFAISMTGPADPLGDLATLSVITALNQVAVGERVSVKFILTGLGNWAAAWKLVEAGVKEAEKHGFWGAVFPDQYMWDPEDLGADSYEGIDHTLDTWVALSHLAAQTNHIHLGTWVTPIPLRPPGVLAKIVSTLDVLSGGRSILGVGAGITQRLFDAYSEWDPPKVRVDKPRKESS